MLIYILIFLSYIIYNIRKKRKYIKEKKEKFLKKLLTYCTKYGIIDSRKSQKEVNKVIWSEMTYNQLILSMSERLEIEQEDEDENCLDRRIKGRNEFNKTNSPLFDSDRFIL